MRKKEDIDLEIIFPQRLEEAMLDRGLDPEDLEADDIIASSTVKYYGKYGGRLPSLRSAVRMAAYLGVSLDWLCGLDDTTIDDFPSPDIVYF